MLKSFPRIVAVLLVQCLLLDSAVSSASRVGIRVSLPYNASGSIQVALFSTEAVPPSLKLAPEHPYAISIGAAARREAEASRNPRDPQDNLQEMCKTLAFLVVLSVAAPFLVAGWQSGILSGVLQSPWFAAGALGILSTGTLAYVLRAERTASQVPRISDAAVEQVKRTASKRVLDTLFPDLNSATADAWVQEMIRNIKVCGPSKIFVSTAIASIIVSNAAELAVWLMSFIMGQKFTGGLLTELWLLFIAVGCGLVVVRKASDGWAYHQLFTRRIGLLPEGLSTESQATQVVGHEDVHFLRWNGLLRSDAISSTIEALWVAEDVASMRPEAKVLSETWYAEAIRIDPILAIPDRRHSLKQGYEAMRYALNHPNPEDRFIALNMADCPMEDDLKRWLPPENYSLSWRRGGMIVALLERYPSGPAQQTGSRARAFLRALGNGMTACEALISIEEGRSSPPDGTSSSRQSIGRTIRNWLRDRWKSVEKRSDDWQIVNPFSEYFHPSFPGNPIPLECAKAA